jgi:hypothetical protein
MTAPAPTAPAQPAKPLDDFGKMAKERLLATINEYNALAAQAKAANGDPNELLDTLREVYEEDENVNKIRATIEDLDDKREKLVSKMDEILRPVVQQRIEAAKQGTEGLDEKLKDLKATVTAGRKYITDLYGEDNLADLPKVAGTRGPNAGGGAGGGRRIRGFDVFVDGELATSLNAKKERVSNMATAAKQIGVETEVLRDAFFAAAGTDDSSKYPPIVEFTVSADVKAEDGTVSQKTYTVRAERVKEGEPRATESDSDDDSGSDEDEGASAAADSAA